MQQEGPHQMLAPRSWTLDPPELWSNTFVLFINYHLWYSVIASQNGLRQASVPFMRAYPHDLVTSQNPDLLQSPQRLGFQHRTWTFLTPRNPSSRRLCHLRAIASETHGFLIQLSKKPEGCMLAFKCLSCHCTLVLPTAHWSALIPWSHQTQGEGVVGDTQWAPHSCQFKWRRMLGEHQGISGPPGRGYTWTPKGTATRHWEVSNHGHVLTFSRCHTCFSFGQ
jgi:hypothetical protein